MLQWVPLKGITDNGIKRLMGSNLSRLTKPQITLSYLMYIEGNWLNIFSQLLESVCLFPKVIPLGEKPGLVVRAEDSRPRGRGFKSRCILDGYKRFASYYIKEKLKIKVAKCGTPKKYF